MPLDQRGLARGIGKGQPTDGDGARLEAGLGQWIPCEFDPRSFRMTEESATPIIKGMDYEQASIDAIKRSWIHAANGNDTCVKFALMDAQVYATLHLASKVQKFLEEQHPERQDPGDE